MRKPEIICPALKSSDKTRSAPFSAAATISASQKEMRDSASMRKAADISDRCDFDAPDEVGCTNGSRGWPQRKWALRLELLLEFYGNVIRKIAKPLPTPLSRHRVVSIDQHIGVYELLSVHATHLWADRRAARILAFLMVSSVMRMMTRGFSLSFPVRVWVPADLVGVLTTNPYGLRPPWGLKMISASVS